MIIPEVTIPIYSIYTLQVFFILFQWINMISRKADRTQFRFLILTITYLAFNTAWIYFLTTLSFTTWKEIPVIGYLGILMTGYTCFYITKEIGFRRPKRSAIELVLFLSIFYSVQQISKSYLPTDIFNYVIISFVLSLQVLTFIRATRLIRPIVKTRISGGSLSPIDLAALIISCIYCFSPVVFALVSESYIEFILINAPFVIISFAYILHHVKQSKSESQLLTNHTSSDTLNGRFNTIENGINKSITEYSELNINGRNDKIAKLLAEYGLTDRELEIAIMILNGTPSKLIGEELDLSYNTIRWHIKQLSEKVGVLGIRDFRKKYQKNYHSNKND